jgi:hypothetical protein
MSITAWQLCSWPPCRWRVPDDCAQWPAFVHVQSSVKPQAVGGREELRQGDTVWVGQLGTAIVGLGWEWIELRRGVFMLKDPNYVATNLQFLDQALAPLDELDAIVSANRVAHALPWQATLTQVLAATRTAEAAPTAQAQRLRPVITPLSPTSPLSPLTARTGALARPPAAGWPSAAAA